MTELSIAQDQLRDAEILQLELQVAALKAQLHQAAADRMLTIDEAATLMRVSPRWIRRHERELPFVRRMSRKIVRVSWVGLQEWMSQSSR